MSVREPSVVEAIRIFRTGLYITYLYISDPLSHFRETFTKFFSFCVTENSGVRSVGSGKSAGGGRARGYWSPWPRSDARADKKDGGWTPFVSILGLFVACLEYYLRLLYPSSYRLPIFCSPLVPETLLVEYSLKTSYGELRALLIKSKELGMKTERARTFGIHLRTNPVIPIWIKPETLLVIATTS